MKPLKKTVFISDIHLDPLRSDISINFFKLIDHLSPEYIDKVYILGDLFEAWIGDDHKTIFHQQVIDQLKHLVSRGVSVSMINGNRDFLLGKNFTTEVGCQLLEDIAVISLYGERVLIMHGDLLCTEDKRYLRMRKIFRKRWLQHFFLRLPLSIRIPIANKIRKQSKTHTRGLPTIMMDVIESEVIKVMQQHAVRYIIHGHTHKQNFHHMKLKSEHAQRIVLGDWHQSGSVLVWDEQHQKNIYNFNQEDLSFDFLAY